MMAGKACIRGLRVTVGMIVGQIAAGQSIDALLSDYPYLERGASMESGCWTEGVFHHLWVGRTVEKHFHDGPAELQIPRLRSG
jgi:Protein of unknown function (DUF433)